MTPKGSLCAALPAAMLLAGCEWWTEQDELCVYTARSPGQLEAEIPRFVARHPEHALRCRGADAADLYCPSRMADEAARCDEQDAEAWVVLRRSTGKLADLLVEEGEETKADVLWGVGISHLWHFRDNTALLRPYRPQHYERVYQMVMSEGRHATLWSSFIEPEVWDLGSYPTPNAVGIDAFAAVFCVDREQVAATIPGWDGTLTWTQVMSLFPGRIAMPNPTTSGSGFAAVAGIREHFRMFGAGTSTQREAAAWSFLRELDAAVAVYTKTGDAPCELVVDGSYAIGITHDAADALPHGGEAPGDGPVRVFPAPDDALGGKRALGYDVAANALIDHGPATRASAQEFLDWALSPEAMEVYAEQTPFVAYPVPGTPMPAGYPADFATLPDSRLEFNLVARERVALQERWIAEFCADEPQAPTSRCWFETE
ncbi:extracellular solute-binding protein [Nannocystis radixulma]|uniref:Extracellular solute-binding protein n=1 Tax=Nannocystis radixulma TaxID=2995305 RepID=A0ABT5B694_9BACT|nr:extracellular solute-binding protein [Nannocystis radixulma]MDC0669243.1 extracellular solute-binding protein [Nannocystis radixulma]